jgi:hypothetical protein
VFVDAPYSIGSNAAQIASAQVPIGNSFASTLSRPTSS